MIKNADIRAACDILGVFRKETIFKIVKQVTGKLM
jgi:hypothetical protein